jgi:hypothetical protein
MQPADILTIIVEKHTHGDLELLAATRTGTFLDLGILKIFVTISDGMLGITGCTFANCSSLIVVDPETKHLAATSADGISEVVSDISVELAVPEHFLADVSLAVTVAVLASLLQHHLSPLRLTS